MSQTTETPVYDQLAAESQWTPDQLRPPYDLATALATSHELAWQKLEARSRLRRLVRTRQRQQARRQRRSTPLP